MIRLPATTIVLGRGDLKDFDERRKHNDQETRLRLKQHVDNHHNLSQIIPVRVRDRSHYGSVEQLACRESRSFDESQQSDSTKSLSRQQDDLYSVHPTSPTTDCDESLADPKNCTIQSPENMTQDDWIPSSPTKDDFHYSGFVETPRSDGANKTRLSSAEARRFRYPIPKSPLFISHNLNNTPERPMTSGLTPRLTSRIASLNTPSILFSQRARRIPQSIRAFRHQTNSFSFDSSERASAAYEQERVVSTSTTGSKLLPTAELNLHAELNEHSLPLSSDDEDNSSSFDNESTKSPLSESLQDNHQNTPTFSQPEFPFSSPQLSLPPPFSTTSRCSSSPDALPATINVFGNHPITSPPPQFDRSSPLDGQGIEISRAESSPLFRSTHSPAIMSPTRRSPSSFFDRAVRIVSEYRVRTPSGNFLQRSSPKRQTQALINFDIRTPSATYRVYDDSLPASAQPQTPAQLPEARHQSRYHPSFTVPVDHDIRAVGPTTRNEDGHGSFRRLISLATPSRRQTGRTNSPAGLRSRGFEGLYGGRENGNEEQDWADGIRFSNVGIRLWGLRDARNDSSSMRETSEVNEHRA